MVEARSEQIANNQHGINSHGYLEAFGIRGHFFQLISRPIR
jgi:hypothetical protein